jgi:hypothetical protein
VTWRASTKPCSLGKPPPSSEPTAIRLEA